MCPELACKKILSFWQVDLCLDCFVSLMQMTVFCVAIHTYMHTYKAVLEGDEPFSPNGENINLFQKFLKTIFECGSGKKFVK